MIKSNSMKFPVRKAISNTNISYMYNEIIDPNKSLEFRGNLGGKNLVFKNGEWISEAEETTRNFYETNNLKQLQIDRKNLTEENVLLRAKYEILIEKLGRKTLESHQVSANLEKIRDKIRKANLR